MSLGTSSSILCTRCGAAAGGSAAECEKCGGKMVKLCGGCSFKNSLQNNYCDRGGASLAAGAPQEAPGPEPESSDIPKTVLRRSSASAPGGLQLPQAGRVEQGPPPTPVPTGTLRKKTTSRVVTRSKPRATPLIRVVLAVLVLIAAGFQYLRLNDPKRTALLAAEEYLASISLQNGPAAYALLSSQAKANCGLEEFKSLLNAPGQALGHFAVDPSKILLSKTAARVPYGKSNASLFLIREGGRWAVPFNRNLLGKAQEALRRGDADMALLLSQSAIRVSPEDPEARGLLCQAYALRKMDTEFQNECLKKS